VGPPQRFFFILRIIYTIHWLRLHLQFRRAEQERRHADRGWSWAEAMYRNIVLQIPQQAHVRRGSDISIPAPQSGKHVDDQGVPESVELERWGDDHYVLKGEDRPRYEGGNGERGS
jgi:hypothetical protein